VFFDRHVKFQYPPSALLAFAGMKALAPGRLRVDDSYSGPRPSINGALSKASVALLALSTALLLELRLRQGRAFAGCEDGRALRAAVVVGLTLTFYPAVKAFTLGNIQAWINALLALALLAWAAGWRASAGVTTGLVCLIKPQYALLLAWAAVRREWRFVVAGTLTACVGLASSIALFGWADHVNYLRAVSYMTEHGEAYFANQSMNGLLNRLAGIGAPELYDNLAFRDDRFAPFTPGVYAGTLLSSAALLLPALFWRGGARDRMLDLCTMVVSGTLASPIAWEHHYGVLLPVFAVLLASGPPRGRRAAWLVLSYVLVSNFFPVANMLAASPLNVAQSSLFAGALILLALLYVQRRDARLGDPRTP
jgi:hypothetical protein